MQNDLSEEEKQAVVCLVNEDENRAGLADGSSNSPDIPVGMADGLAKNERISAHRASISTATLFWGP